MAVVDQIHVLDHLQGECQTSVFLRTLLGHAVRIGDIQKIDVPYIFHGSPWPRRANAALYRVAIVRMCDDDQTKAYAARRTTEGKTRREILRYIMREIYSSLGMQPTASSGGRQI